MKKILVLIFAFLFTTAASAESLKIGIMAGPNEKLFNSAAKLAKEKYNLDVKAAVFTDYQFPNEALNNGDIDANFFQTQEFLDASIDAKKYEIETVANSFIYPMGIYSKKIKNIAGLKENAVIIIPNGASNQSRALILLKDAGIIELSKINGKFYTPRDVKFKDKKFKITPINAPQMPRYVLDGDILVLNNDFVLPAGFKFSDALVAENAENAKAYINVLVARKNSNKKSDLNTFIKILQSNEFEQETYKFYPSAIKAW